MVKGGGNGVSLLILAFRWWVDSVDDLKDGDLKEWSNKWLENVMKELDDSLAGVLGSSTLQKITEGREEEGNEESEEETRPKKR